MRSLLLENSSSQVTYYIPFVRSYDAIKNGFSPEEILEIQTVIPDPSSLKELEDQRSVKLVFDKERLLGSLGSRNTNLATAIEQIEISTENENDPVTKEIADIIHQKLDLELKPVSRDSSLLSGGETKMPIDAMSISTRGLELIKKFEGFRATPYICPGGKLSIGYGNTIKEGEYTKISKEQAESLLRSTVSSFEKAIKKAVKVPLTQNQYDSLVSLAYNIGSGAFSKSTLVNILNTGDYRGAANEFNSWVKSNGKILSGLQRRREEEKSLFLS